MLVSLARMQRAQGNDVKLFCLLQRGPLEARLSDAGIEVYQCRNNPLQASRLGRLCTVFELLREFRAWRPALLHCHNMDPTLYGALAARLAGVRNVISTRHGFGLPAGHTRKERIFWAVSRLCKRVVAVSESGRNSMAALPYSLPGRIMTIRNGVAPQPVTAPGEERTGFTLITVARLAPPKDHPTLLRALALVAPEIPDLRLLIVGGGVMETRLQALAAELKIEHHVRFLGERDDVGNWLARSDAFVLSSTSEGLPISMLEAMAAGLPLILSDVGGISEVARNLPGARLVPPSDIPAMAAAILEFSQERPRLAGWGEGNRRHYEENFSPEGMARQYDDLYASLGRRSTTTTRTA
jgi:L-malate glycosyltransferase